VTLESIEFVFYRAGYMQKLIVLPWLEKLNTLGGKCCSSLN